VSAHSCVVEQWTFPSEVQFGGEGWLSQLAAHCPFSHMISPLAQTGPFNVPGQSSYEATQVPRITPGHSSLRVSSSHLGGCTHYVSVSLHEPSGHTMLPCWAQVISVGQSARSVTQVRPSGHRLNRTFLPYTVLVHYARALHVDSGL